MKTFSIKLQDSSIKSYLCDFSPQNNIYQAWQSNNQSSSFDEFPNGEEKYWIIVPDNILSDVSHHANGLEKELHHLRENILYNDYLTDIISIRRNRNDDAITLLKFSTSESKKIKVSYEIDPIYLDRIDDCFQMKINKNDVIPKESLDPWYYKKDYIQFRRNELPRMQNYLIGCLCFKDKENINTKTTPKIIDSSHIDLAAKCFYHPDVLYKRSASDRKNVILAINDTNTLLRYFAIANINESDVEYSPCITRIGIIEEEEDVPIIWQLLQDKNIITQLEMFLNPRLNSISFSALFSKIKYKDKIDKESLHYKVICFMYYIAHLPHYYMMPTFMYDLMSATKKVLSSKKNEYYVIYRRLEILQCVADKHSNKQIVFINGFNNETIDRIRGNIPGEVESIDITTIKRLALYKKVLESNMCILSVDIFNFCPQYTNEIIEVVRIMNSKIVFIDLGNETCDIKRIPASSLSKKITGILKHINYCKLGSDIGKVESDIKKVFQARRNKKAILSNLLFDLSNLSRDSFKYKKNKDLLSNRELDFFVKFKNILIEKAFELKSENNSDEYLYDNYYNYEILLHELLNLEEEFINHKNLSSEAWNAHIKRKRGNKAKGSNLTRFIRSHKEAISYCKDLLPNVYEYTRNLLNKDKAN